MLPTELAMHLGLSGELPHLEAALTHPSFANEQRRGRGDPPVVDNQRLEFLGDAVLGVCVSELLIERLPRADEGELSLVRSSLVNAEALAKWARSVGLGHALRLGRGADAAGERDRTNVLADAVEALVAAVYLDCGMEAAHELSRAIVAESLSDVGAGAFAGRDAKSELQEQVQATGRPSPRYHVVSEEGPAHRREFVVEVRVDDDVLGSGRGASKKIAEQAAARDAILARSAPRPFRGARPPSRPPESPAAPPPAEAPAALPPHESPAAPPLPESSSPEPAPSQPVESPAQPSGSPGSSSPSAAPSTPPGELE